MSDDPNKTGATDRDRISLQQDHEVWHFVNTIKKQFPGKSAEEIEKALKQAAKQAGGSESRSLLTEKVTAILKG